MKSKSVLLVCVLITIVGAVFSSSTLKTVSSENNIVISAIPAQSKFTLGEPVSIDIEIINQGDSEVYLHGTTAQSGYVKFFISDDGKKFKEYRNGAWGHKKTKGFVLLPNSPIRSQATILANSIPSTSHLNDKAIREITAKRLVSAYAFPKAGSYFFKTVLVIPNQNGNKEIESETIRIQIEEPQGKDLEVWSKIKERPDFAYFIQNGELVDFRSYEEKAKFLQEVEQILTGYPDSLYSESLRQSRAKFRASEAKSQ